MKSSSAIIVIPLVALVFSVTGCSREKETSPVAVTPSKVEPGAIAPVPKVQETGTVKVEFDIIVDPKAIISISGNEYSPGDFKEPMTLKAGLQTLTVKQPGLELDPQEFTVKSGKRSIVRIQEPNRRAAEWIIKLGGSIHIHLAEKGGRDVTKVEDLPATPFHVVTVNSGLSTQLTDEGLENLTGLKHLENLLLAGSTISDTGLERIKGQLPTLQNLQISGVTDAGLKHLEGLTGLNSLTVVRSPITDDGLQTLRGLSRLTMLNLEGNQVTSTGLKHLQHLTKITYLCLNDTNVDSDGLRCLTAWKELRELYVRGTKVSDAGLQHLSGLTKLWRLDLAHTAVSDAGLKHLEELKELDGLWLYDTQITDTGLLHLSKLTALQELVLARTKVSDAGLQHLSGLTNIWRLELSGTAVSDAGMEYLKVLTKLRELYLYDTKVTAAGVTTLKELLPQCVVGK